MKILLLLIGTILITVSCKKNQLNINFEDDPSIQNINGTWVVVSYENYAKMPVVMKNDVDSWNGMDVVLTFSIDSLYGRNTTNTISGNFTLSGRTIQIIRYGGTKIGQPTWGNMFSDVVHTFESFKINENQLKFYFDDNRSSVTLIRK
jgi:heat shock protein HslJ